MDETLRIVAMWQHVIQFGEVCPANWQKREAALQATLKGVSDYLAKHMNQ